MSHIPILPRGDEEKNSGMTESGEVAAYISDIYNQYLGDIFRYCRYRLFYSDIAEDATSAVFLQLVEQFEHVKHKTGPELRNWLYGIASNIVASHLREAKRRRKLALIAQERIISAGESASAYCSLDWPLLYSAISSLKEQDQNLLALRFYQNLQTSVIAQILEMNHSTVRSDLSRILRRLRSTLAVKFAEQR